MKNKEKLYTISLASTVLILLFILMPFTALADPAQTEDGRFTLTETQITPSKSNQTFPAIYGDKIVWQDDRNGNGCSLFMYDLSTSKEIQITTNKSWEWKPAIYEDKIAWQYAPSGYPYLHMYNISTSIETQVSSNGAWEPAIYEDRVACADTRNGNADIYLYNLSTLKETRITTNKSAQVYPDIYGDIIVWQDSRNGNGYDPTDIYMYDLSTSKETQLTNDEFDQYNPVIFKDRILWQDHRNGNWDIYMYNLSTKKETQITNKESDEESPAIHENRIVWMDNRNGMYDIYMYDLSTSTETQITTNESYQIYPAIYGNRIVWEDYRHGTSLYGLPDRNVDIYMCTVSTTDSGIQTLSANFSANVSSGASPLEMLFNDTSTGIPTAWSWNFGDGTYASTRNVTHVFKKAGKFIVKLTVTNAAGNKSTKSSYLNVTVPLKKPVAAFYACPISGKVPLKVKFTDLSKGSPASWKWNFGDGKYSTAKSPAHKYTKAGKYTVSLTVKNAVGSSTVKKPAILTVKSR
jgi:beta propeller repeat protein